MRPRHTATVTPSHCQCTKQHSAAQHSTKSTSMIPTIATLAIHNICNKWCRRGAGELADRREPSDPSDRDPEGRAPPCQHASMPACPDFAPFSRCLFTPAPVFVPAPMLTHWCFGGGCATPFRLFLLPAPRTTPARPALFPCAPCLCRRRVPGTRAISGPHLRGSPLVNVARDT